MNRVVVLTAAGAIVASGVGVAVATGAASHPKAETIPSSVHRAHVNIKTAHGYSRRGNTVTGAAARNLVRDFNALSVVPKGQARACPLDRGRREIVAFRFNGNVLDASAGFCGYVDVVRDGKKLRALNDSAAFERDIHADLAPAPPKRPKAEHVPDSVSHAKLHYSVFGTAANNETVTESGRKARRLVHEFDRLKVEPKDTVHCDLAGGPTTTVTFRDKAHTWVAREAACTDVMVTRDGKALPTLLPSTAWEKTVARDLGH